MQPSSLQSTHNPHHNDMMIIHLIHNHNIQEISSFFLPFVSTLVFWPSPKENLNLSKPSMVRSADPIWGFFIFTFFRGWPYIVCFGVVQKRVSTLYGCC
ncbi:unnamed protein product [Brassica oleracea]|uniref:(rape) hypothetical protein n=1 Tax=Brassica napus TaxID=3708 RepID=A0A816HVX1_BRANA|nr:unnamed protein product [Brassica napus]